MAPSASTISAAMKPLPSNPMKEIDSAATASTSAATRRTRPTLMPAICAGAAAACVPDAGPPAAFSGSGLKPALRMAASASGNAPSSVVMAMVRSPRRKRSALTPATGSRARRMSDSSTAQSMVGMRKSRAPLGTSATSGASGTGPWLPPQQASAACEWA